MSESSFKSISQYIEEFQGHMAFGIQSIHAAACIYATAVRKFPTNGAKRFREKFPKIGEDTWTVLKLIGNEKLVPEAYMMNRKSAVKFAKIPVEQQRVLVASKGVTVVSQKTLTEINEPVDICDLTPQQAQIVIDENKKRIRTVEEQMAYVRKGLNAWSNKKQSSKKVNWEIRGHKLVVLSPCSFDAGLLKTILEQISA